jgi:hypothetical protein
MFHRGTELGTTMIIRDDTNEGFQLARAFVATESTMSDSVAEY